MKILVISSCTDDKLGYKAPAAKMYTGPQHTNLMEGLEQVWKVHGKQTIDLAIISAKHGLLNECKVIAPYDCTFPNGRTKAGKRRIKERSNCLKIHEHTMELIRHYDLVFFLLGNEYVQALQLPFGVTDAVTQIFLLGSTHRRLIPNSPNVHFVPAGSELAKELSVMGIALKGVVFKKLCDAVCREGLEVFETVRQNPQLILDLVRNGEG